jgi:hypothetical protein
VSVIARRSIEAGRRDLGYGAKDKGNFFTREEADKIEKALPTKKNVHGVPGRQCIYGWARRVDHPLLSNSTCSISTGTFHCCVRAFTDRVRIATMFHGDSGGGGGVGRTCMSLPLGKYIRRALRGSGGRGKPRLKDKERSMSSLSVELITSSSSSASASWSMSAAASSSSSSSVVRVVLWSGLVEVYTGVILACTVIRRHPPGLCLAHTDVFRNPHRATLRPLEPLFPGQKFFLLPETTVRKLQRDIPLDAPFRGKHIRGAANIEEDEEEGASTEMSPSRSRSWSDEDRRPAPERRCCAKDYYVNRERWAELQFKSMVDRGLAAEQSSSRRSASDRTNKRKMRRTKPPRRDLLSSGGMPLPMTSRAWEPSLAPVQEEAVPSSPEPQTIATSPALGHDHIVRSRVIVVS